MAYCIMRSEKCKMQAVGGRQAENNRTEEDARTKNFVNSDIDIELTKLNYYFIKNDNWKKEINAEISTVLKNKKPRKDAVVMIDSFYTFSPEWEAELYKHYNKPGDNRAMDIMHDYFQDCLNWHERHLGKVFNAVVHLDETTPHLHIQSVPLINGKLSAKELMGNLKSYGERQESFYQEVGKKYGLERGIRKEKGQARKHYECAERKAIQLEKMIAGIAGNIITFKKNVKMDYVKMKSSRVSTTRMKHADNILNLVNDFIRVNDKIITASMSESDKEKWHELTNDEKEWETFMRLI